MQVDRAGEEEEVVLDVVHQAALPQPGLKGLSPGAAGSRREPLANVHVRHVEGPRARHQVPCPSCPGPSARVAGPSPTARRPASGSCSRARTAGSKPATRSISTSSRTEGSPGPTRKLAEPAGSPMAEILVGTSGWSEDDWVGPFHPKAVDRSDWLGYYAQRFPTVEVNYTFYQTPAADRMQTLAGRFADPDLEGVFEAPQTITHEAIVDGREPLAQRRLATFFDAMQPVAEGGRDGGRGPDAASGRGRPARARAGRPWPDARPASVRAWQEAWGEAPRRRRSGPTRRLRRSPGPRRCGRWPRRRARSCAGRRSGWRIRPASRRRPRGTRGKAPASRGDVSARTSWTRGRRT
ncbi:hypothetical protein BRD56_10765 [Thermoplasmatales archaeon SW_10_69_26]|nr:MAG: hypothetical protein BRD56_10765 [Thermoplasmatales archaeon SW_10_69_26]